MAAILVPLALIIAYYDVRYRRIPNPFVLAGLLGGLLYSAAKGSGRDDSDAREGLTLRAASGGWRAGGRAFMKTHGY